MPSPCPGGYLCTTGSVNATVCPSGFYCPPQTSAALPCPSSHYCPPGSPSPLLCPRGTYCPVRSVFPLVCAPGSYSPPDTTNASRASEAEACIRCPPGTYSGGTNGQDCEPCRAGYVCVGGTRSATPASLDTDNGYPCPPGA